MKYPRLLNDWKVRASVSVMTICNYLVNKLIFKFEITFRPKLNCCFPVQSLMITVSITKSNSIESGEGEGEGTTGQAISSGN